MTTPWLKFYPNDWRGDPRLRMCSLAARGLWADLIAYMHEGEPYGHLLINGKPPSADDIAALVGRPRAEVKKALAELDERQVCSRTKDGTIYSRRMVRDRAKSQEGKQWADKRWAKGEPTGPPNGSPTGTPITQKPESERKKDAADAAPEDLEKDLFARGKQVAGKDAGGLIAKVLKAKKGSVALARAAIELAATKQNPREYLGAVVAGGQPSEDGKRLTNDEAYWGVGRTPGIL